MKHITQKLHIAIVSDAVYPYNIGGKEKRIYELSKRLVAKGHNVTIYCMKWWDTNEHNVTHDGVIFEAISPYIPLYAGERRSIKQGVLFALHTLKLIKKDFDILDVDHMPHLVLFPTKLVCMIKRKKLIATWHEVWGKKYWIKYLGKLGILAYLIEKMSVTLPDTILSGSQHTADRLSSEFCRTQGVHAVPNGINASAMNYIKSANLRSDIIFAGRLLQHKNVAMLIHAVAALKIDFPTISCIIIGSGPEETPLKELVKNLKLQKNVTFLNFIENHDKFYSLIKASKVFVLPSSREGFGIATIEAQALGIPVITYNHPHNGSRKLINNGVNGYLFDENKRSLEEAISKSLSTKWNNQKIKATVAHYDWETIVKKIEEIYKS